MKIGSTSSIQNVFPADKIGGNKRQDPAMAVAKQQKPLVEKSLLAQEPTPGSYGLKGEIPEKKPVGIVLKDIA